MHAEQTIHYPAGTLSLGTLYQGSSSVLYPWDRRIPGIAVYLGSPYTWDRWANGSGAARAARHYTAKLWLRPYGLRRYATKASAINRWAGSQATGPRAKFVVDWLNCG
ncbi:MAG: hypothetical protein NXI32_08620 [bacterium]|nr:hypothetical protein [bacterium]